jgi:hypothetical protein
LPKLGQYYSDMVDAYYDPEEWKPTEAAADSLPAKEFLSEFRATQEQLEAQDTASLSADEQRRRENPKEVCGSR